MGGEPHRVVYFWHYVGNRLLTILSNMFTNLTSATWRRLQSLSARIDSVDHDSRVAVWIEPEITAKIAASTRGSMRWEFSYSGREYAEGKKITWRDGLRALWCIARYSLLAENSSAEFVIGIALFYETTSHRLLNDSN